MMCHSPAFTMWLFMKEDQHPGALRALACGVAVDPEPLICPFCSEPDPCACTTGRLGNNLVAPMTFTDWEIDRFIRDNVCSLHRSHLVKYPAANIRLWTANCPTCGPIMQHNWCRKSQLERIESDETAARYELRDETKSTNPLEDLGY